MTESEERICPLCGSKMEKGFLRDNSFTTRYQKWFQYPEGLKRKLAPQSHVIISYRCIKCGYLQNFAPDLDPIENIKDQLL
jgi:hypothetical protein